MNDLSDMISSLPLRYKRIVKIGNLPYQKNLKTLRDIDIRGDITTGKKTIKRMIVEMDALIKEMEIFKDASEKIGNIANTIIRSSKNDI